MDLATVLADAFEEAAVLRRNRAPFSVERVEEILRNVGTATEEFTAWVSEREACMRSGHKAPWFAQRFAEWERQGHARWNPQRPRERQYRLLIVPLAHDADSVKADARRAARDASEQESA
jgi:hypothetical protein